MSDGINTKRDMESLNRWSEYENETAATSFSSRQNLVEGNTNPRRRCVHQFFIVYSTLAGVSAAVLGLSQFLGMAIEGIPAERNSIVRYSLCLYLIVMCGLAVLNELEWFSFIIYSRLLTNWVSRGFFYVFMALLSFDQASVSQIAKEQELEFIKAVSYFFGAIGLGYVVMGTFCCQVVLNKFRKEHVVRTENAILNRKEASQQVVRDET